MRGNEYPFAGEGVATVVRVLLEVHAFFRARLAGTSTTRAPAAAEQTWKAGSRPTAAR